MYYTRSEVVISTRKNMFVMNWYSFLGHDYSFCNANVSCLIPLTKTIFLVFAIVCRRLDPPSMGNRPYGHPLLIFFPNPPLLARFFRQYRPNETLNKHNNKLMWQGYVFIFRTPKNTVTYFLCKKKTFISNTDDAPKTDFEASI